jgi:hypothetical protein
LLEPITVSSIPDRKAIEGKAVTKFMSFKPGDYNFLPVAAGPFSAGIAAMPGFALRRARFSRPVPMADGFALIKNHLEAAGRSVHALAACELRSPAPMTPGEFKAFNDRYLETLHHWGCRLGDLNPLARSNIAPITEVPDQAQFFAFTYTVPEAGAPGDFLISGKPEIVDGASGADRVFGGQDISAAGLEAKVRYVMNCLREWVGDLEMDWRSVTAAQLYTVHDIRPLMQSVFSAMQISQIGLSWYPAWPPITEMHFEADVRRVRTELIL